MSLFARRQLLDLTTNIDTTQLTRASKLVSNYTSMSVQPNKAIVGANAFAHEAGIHQDGMLKNNLTYEIMRPETVGVTQSKLVLGKHSGRHALKERLVSMGYSLDEDALNKVFERFKVLADKKKTITDADIEALISDEIYQPKIIYTLDGLQVACGTMGLPTATVRLGGPDGSAHVFAAIGTGPVDAAFKAIDAIVKEPSTLVEFVIHAITEGIDAQGEVTVRIAAEHLPATRDAQKENERVTTFGGYGADTDIIVAATKAYLSALNKLLVATGKYGPVETPAVLAVQ
jgi:2-isopropylmalate synthase